MEDGTVVEVTCSGAWLTCDNGCLKWYILVPAFKFKTNRVELCFSEWLESIRKNVECTFGILKQRWRIFKTGIRIHSIESAENFKTCCALHKFLLDADGMDVPWDGEHECVHEDSTFEDFNPPNTPNAVHELHRENGDLSTIDSSSVGTTNLFVHEDFMIEEPYDENSEEDEAIADGVCYPEEDMTSVREISSLLLDFFRSKLVVHFNILFEM